MRIGIVWDPCPNANYRARDPGKAMVRRGHDVAWPTDSQGIPDVRLLRQCDVVHVYRRAQDDVRKLLSDLARGGTAIVYDNDDDFTAVPKESPDYKKLGGLAGQRVFAMTVKTARLARVFTTTNEVLAEKYRNAGVERAEVIGNYLSPDVARPQRSHEGIVIGWIAGKDHRADTARIDIAGALGRLIATHPDVRVECIGIDLRLPERYRHDLSLPFEDLPARTGGFDIGIAPLADIPANWTRSDIKLKEYAASGVPWLASPIGPYLGLGESEGGRLVEDDAWFDALDRLVTKARERRKLARKAKAWAKRQTIDAVAERWEQVFAEAAAR